MKRIRVAAILISAGLLAEVLTLRWSHPTAFFVFAGVTGATVGAGLFIFLSTFLRSRR